MIVAFLAAAAGIGTASPPAVATDLDSSPAMSAATGLEYRFDPSVDPTPLQISLGALAQEPAATLNVDESAPYFGAKGSRRLNIHAHYGEDVKGEDNHQYLAGAGISWFIEDNFSVDLELNGMYLDQERGEETWGVNANLLFRWHFLARESWSLYVDGGAGALLTGDDAPDNGSEFNFTPQAGFGATFDIGNDNRLMVGARWHHISNANLYDENPGRDSVVAYAGVSVPF